MAGLTEDFRLIAWIQGGWGFDLLFGLLAVAALIVLVAVLLLPKAGQAEGVA